MSLTNHAKRLRELAEIKFDMALVMGLGTYQDLWRSDAAAVAWVNYQEGRNV